METKKRYIFATVKARHSFECLTSCKNIDNPLGDGSEHLTLMGFLFLRHAVRAKLAMSNCLGQANSVLDKTVNLAGQLLFLGGLFLSFPFVITLINFSLSFFW